MRYLFFYFLCAVSLFALKVEISSSEVANGQSVLFTFVKEKGLSFEKALLDDREYKILPHPKDPQKMYLLLPVSYYAKAGDKKVKILYSKDNSSKEKVFFIRIKDGNYKKESIKVSSSKVHLNKKDKQRAAKEYKEAMRVYNTLTPKSFISLAFIAPMQSKITSAFGKARVYNGSLKGYHSGTDFRAKVGEPIKAANDGKVVLCKERFYSGGSVVIDHGEGIYTCYFHLSKFLVKRSQWVKKGQIIALSGKSGRVTGPHLHFAARVKGVQVDPLQLMTLMNENILGHSPKTKE